MINLSNETYEIYFTNSKIYTPKEPNYDSNKNFLWFDNYNVLTRDRVKYVSLRYGVPISSQWNKQGHLYPVQIAQFGLSHYSKFFSKKTVKNQNHELNPINFVSNQDKNMLIKFQNGFEFNFPEKSIYKLISDYDFHLIQIEISAENFVELFFDVIFRESINSYDKHVIRVIYELRNAQFYSESFNNESKNTIHKITYKLNYKFVDKASDNSFKFMRNICIDACKGLAPLLKKCDLCYLTREQIHNEIENATLVTNFHYFKVYQFSLRGSGKFKNAFLNERINDIELAKLAADYFVETQDKHSGGWHMNITRKFDFLSSFYLKPGWYSAMAQGHAISLLCRLYAHTKIGKYLETAERAIKLYEKRVDENGIKAEWNFNNKSIIWLEEYPTRPNHLFVLNGFIYSLFGLIDFMNSDCGLSSVHLANVKKIFFAALDSLKTMINFYDTGSRSLYDLRHLTNPKLNPNVARWDYHTLHINQLLFLENILNSLKGKISIFNESEKEILNEYAQILSIIAIRWTGYVNGASYQNSQIKF